MHGHIHQIFDFKKTSKNSWIFNNEGLDKDYLSSFKENNGKAENVYFTNNERA